MFWGWKILQQPDKTEEYLETVQQQIRWKRARHVVAEEIRAHLEDQKEAYLKSGSSEEDATSRAITEMGDPVTVGEQLDRVHRPRPDWALLAMTAVLLLFGLLVPAVTGGTVFDGHFGLSWLWNQAIYIGIAIPVMLAAYFMDFTILGKFPKMILALFYFSLFVCYFLKIGISINYRQYSMTYLMLLFPTVFAGFVYGMRGKGYGGLIFCMAAILIPCLLVTPDVTVWFLLCVSCYIVLTAAVLKGWFHVVKKAAMLILYLPCAGVITAGILLYCNSGSKRLLYIIDPGLAPNAEGYMGTMIRKIISCARPIGEGIAVPGYDAYAVTQLLPDIKTDFLLTYIAYRFGWIVLLAILGLLLAFLIRAGILCKKQKSVLGFLTCLAVLSTLALQCLIYIVSNLGMLIFSPLSLPLISFGGQYLVINMFLIGLLLSVFRTGELATDTVSVRKTGFRRLIRYHDGEITIRLK